MRFFEYRSKKIRNDDHDFHESRLERTLNEWGKEGWEVISVVVPDHHNYDTFVATAKRELLKERLTTGRKFR